MVGKRVFLFLIALVLIFSTTPGMKLYAEELPSAAQDPFVQLEDGSIYPVVVNQAREEDKLSVCTSEYGENTDSFYNDTSEAIIVNNVVLEKNSYGDNGTYIPKNGAVLSGTGTAKEIVNTLKIGQRVELKNINLKILPEKYFLVNNMTVSITGVNTVRGAGAVIAYTPEYGTSTKTNEWGMEITAVDGKVVHITPDATTGNTQIPDNGVVISVQSGYRDIKKLISSVRVGDSIEVVLDNLYIYNAYEIPYDAFNPKTKEDNPEGWDDSKNEPYPGFRGANQSIVYDSTYGETTGTNQWGYEVSVNSDGKIFKAGGNNSPIPDGGLVISTHGTKSSIVANNDLIGATVVVNKAEKKVVILHTPDSFLTKMEFKAEEVRKRIEEEKKLFLDVPYNAVQDKLASIQARYSEAKRLYGCYLMRDAIAKSKELEQMTEEVYFMNSESRTVETRGVWIRPFETSEQEVDDVLQRLHAMNINTVYLETWFNGYTAFKTENKLTCLNPIYNGFDVLKAYVDLAKKYDIKIYAWVENFFAGVNGEGPVIEKKPEWALISRFGNNANYIPDYNAYFNYINPALPEVRDFLSDLYKELVKKYKIDGIQLDYIRYPAPNSAKDGIPDDFGYDEYTRQLYMKSKGSSIDPINITPQHELWADWCKFRADFINTFVYRVTSEVKSIRPEVLVSADVGAQYDSGPTEKMQEPKDWVGRGYIDELLPMIYTNDLEKLKHDIVETKKFTYGKTHMVIGLGAENIAKGGILSEEVKAVRELGASGAAVFEYRRMIGNGFDDELYKGVYQKKAVVSTTDPKDVLEKLFSEIERKMETIYVPFGGMPIKSASNYKKCLEHISKEYSNKTFKVNIIIKCKSDLEKLLRKIDGDSEIAQEVKNRMIDDINICTNVLDIYQSKTNFMANHKADYFTLEVPQGNVAAGDTLQVKVKAAFIENDHQAVMYLDPTQYTIKSSNPEVVKAGPGSITILKENCNAALTVTVNKKFRLNIKPGADIKAKILLIGNEIKVK